MKFRWLAVLVVLVMMAAAGSASAQMMGGGMGMGMHGGGTKGEDRGGMMAGRGGDRHFLHQVHILDLTDEQEKAVEAIHFSHRKEAVRKNADREVAEIELQEILVEEPVNIAAAEKKIRAIASFRADLKIMHLKEREAIKEKLTPEQLEKLNKQLRAERHERMAGKGGMGMHGGKRPGRSLTGDTDDSDDDGGTESDAAGEENKGH